MNTWIQYVMRNGRRAHIVTPDFAVLVNFYGLVAAMCLSLPFFSRTLVSLWLSCPCIDIVCGVFGKQITCHIRSQIWSRGTISKELHLRKRSGDEVMNFELMLKWDEILEVLEGGEYIWHLSGLQIIMVIWWNVSKIVVINSFPPFVLMALLH